MLFIHPTVWQGVSWLVNINIIQLDLMVMESNLFINSHLSLLLEATSAEYYG